MAITRAPAPSRGHVTQTLGVARVFRQLLRAAAPSRSCWCSALEKLPMQRPARPKDAQMTSHLQSDPDACP
eukprot:2655161-Pleurochrysis_carterae.AAC.2